MASNFFRESLSLIAMVLSFSKASLDTPKASAMFLSASAGGMLLPQFVAGKAFVICSGFFCKL